MFSNRLWEFCKIIIHHQNAQAHKDRRLLSAKKAAIIAFHDQNLTEGYRRLTWMMNDLNIVAASPFSVRRVLVQAGRLRRRDISKSRKGKGFEQPLKPHEHWHTDITFVRIGGKYYPLCSFLEVCSRLIVHWEIRETMTKQYVEIVFQRARELVPHARPRIISDNGPQYISSVSRILSDESCADITVLSAVKRQNRAMA